MQLFHPFSALHLETLGIWYYRSWDWTDPLIELNEVQTSARQVCHLGMSQKPGTLVNLNSMGISGSLNGGTVPYRAF